MSTTRRRLMYGVAASGASALLLAPNALAAIDAVTYPDADTDQGGALTNNEEIFGDSPDDFVQYGGESVFRDNPADIVAEILGDPEYPQMLESAAAEGNLTTLPVTARVADQSVYLSWVPPVFKDAFTYQVVGWETNNSKNKLPTQTVTLPKATFTGLDNGTSYTFYVVSYGMSGNTVYSYAQATPVGVVTKPTDAPRLISSDDSSITVSVRPLRETPATGPIAGYQVMAVDAETGNEYTASTTETRRPVITVDGLQPNTKYDLVYAGMNKVNGKLTLGEYGDNALTVITNDTTAPQNLEVTNVSNRKVSLGWDAVDGATKYVVYYNDASDPYGEEFTMETTDLAATVSGLTNDVTYEFEVAAEIERDGELIVGDRTDPVLATPTGPLPPSDFRIQGPGNKSMFFEWNPVSGAEGYQIATELFDARGIDNPNVPDPVFIAAHDGEMDEKVDGLTNGAEYRFRIATVVDGEPGKYTTDENSPLGIPMGVPGTTDPSVSAVTKTSIEVTYPAPTVTEDASRATKYEVTFTPVNGDPVVVESSTTSAKADGLTDGVTYTVSVKAGNNAGYGPASPNPIQVTTADKPGVVQNLTAQRAEAGTTANLTWDAPAPDASTSAPSAYKVDATPVDPADPDPAAQVVTDTAASFAGLAATGDYEFTVVGVTDAGDGPVARVGSIGEMPAPAPVAYGFDNATASFTFPAASVAEHQAQARAWQQAAPGDAALTAAIRDGKADQLIDNQLAVVEPSSLTCTDGTCTAVFENFADNLNGEAWVFQARYVDGEMFASNWADAAVTPVADAATATTEDFTQIGQGCPSGTTEVGDKCREYKDYTYHQECTQDCHDNCASAYLWPEGNCPGPNCCNATNNCWGGGVDGNCAADGTICCGGSRGQSCTTNCNTVKDATPAGWSDDGSRWYRDVDPTGYKDYFVKSTFTWTPEDRAANGVVNMLVAGNTTTDGKSEQLGRCPGDVPVKLIGLGGHTAVTYNLCN